MGVYIQRSNQKKHKLLGNKQMYKVKQDINKKIAQFKTK